MRVVAEVVEPVTLVVGQHLVPTTADIPMVECGDVSVVISMTVQEAAAVAEAELAMVEAVVELDGITVVRAIMPVAMVLLP
jgi:hypothetical protein